MHRRLLISQLSIILFRPVLVFPPATKLLTSAMLLSVRYNILSRGTKPKSTRLLIRLLRRSSNSSLIISANIFASSELISLLVKKSDRTFFKCRKLSRRSARILLWLKSMYSRLLPWPNQVSSMAVNEAFVTINRLKDSKARNPNSPIDK